MGAVSTGLDGAAVSLIGTAVSSTSCCHGRANCNCHAASASGRTVYGHCIVAISVMAFASLLRAITTPFIIASFVAMALVVYGPIKISEVDW